MPAEADPKSLAALTSNSLGLLRQLAVQNLESLGVSDSRRYVEQEMIRTFSALAASVPAGENTEEKLCAAIRRAIDEVGV